MMREDPQTQERPTTQDLAAAGRSDEITREDEATATMPRPPETHRGPLFDDGDLDGYRRRWQEVQVRFVDEPRDTVQEADSLVAELMQRLAETFAEERSNLESQWEGGRDASTEDLRVAMQRYRSFFDRLLAA